MKPIITTTIVSVFLLAGAALGQEGSALTLAPAQPFSASVITATGRVQPLVCARVGSRVGGRIADFARPGGVMLDVGMTVQKGQELFHLDTTTFDNMVASAQAALNSAQATYANLVAHTRTERITVLQQAIRELEARQEERLSDRKRYERLVEKETLPGKRLEEVGTELRVLAAGLEIARARLREAEAGPTETEKAVAQARIEEARAMLQTARTDLRDSVVLAPFTGLVTRRYKSPGDYVTGQPHTEVVELMSIDMLEVELRLPEAYYRLVKPGQTPVELRCPLMDKKVRTTVGRVVANIESATGTFCVRVPIPPAERNGIVPGVFVTADVALDSQPLGVLVPLRALVEADGKAVLFVAEAGRMVRREVEVGDRLTESVVVKTNLKPGEKVVVGPPGALKDGAALPAYLVSADGRPSATGPAQPKDK